MERRNLLLCITGGIAAYKAPFLIRLFQQNNLRVRTVATEHALEFVTAVTLEALSGFPVSSGLFDKKEHDYEHIELAKWADVMVVAPATANSIAKFAGGVADDLLSTLFVAFKNPVVLAPAMNDAMITDATVEENLRKLHEHGVRICQPVSGYLACGSEGPGRMADVESIVDAAMMCFSQRSVLEGRNVLVTAGATRERIDPVRFISNRSSGKMGYAVAEAFLKYGAQVTLVTGPSHIYPPPGAEVVRIESAREMHEAVTERSELQDIIIKAAAVADYTPAEAKDQKIKKSGDGLELRLERTPDILGSLGKRKRAGQILIGFSAETENHLKNSVRKLESKNLDMIVLNDVSSPDSGFQVDTNRVMFITPLDENADTTGKEVRDIDGKLVELEATPLLSKHRVAEMIALKTIRIITEKQG